MGKNQKTDTLEKRRNEQSWLYKTFHTPGADVFVIEDGYVVEK